MLGPPQHCCRRCSARRRLLTCGGTLWRCARARSAAVCDVSAAHLFSLLQLVRRLRSLWAQYQALPASAVAARATEREAPTAAQQQAQSLWEKLHAVRGCVRALLGAPLTRVAQSAVALQRAAELFEAHTGRPFMLECVGHMLSHARCGTSLTRCAARQGQASAGLPAHARRRLARRPGFTRAAAVSAASRPAAEACSTRVIAAHAAHGAHAAAAALQPGAARVRA